MAPLDLKLTKNQEDRAHELHSKAIVVDNSIVLKQEDEYFERMKKGGITAHNHTVTRIDSGISKSINELAYCLRWLDQNEDKAILAVKVADIVKAKKDGKVAIIFGPQNLPFFERDVGVLTPFHKLGVRILQPTYQNMNQAGSGCGERVDGGLSNFGIEVVHELNRLGIVVDLSHCGPKTTADAIEYSKAPPIFSHSHPYALTPFVRNKTDDLIRAMAEKGGVMGMTAFAPISEIKKGVRPTVNETVTHIDYLCNLVGVDHVGLSSDIDETFTKEKLIEGKRLFPEIYRDYTWETRRVEGWTDITMIYNVTRALVSRGYSDKDILKILGENWLRVFKRVWGA